MYLEMCAEQINLIMKYNIITLLLYLEQINTKCLKFKP